MLGVVGMLDHLRFRAEPLHAKNRAKELGIDDAQVLARAGQDRRLEIEAVQALRPLAPGQHFGALLDREGDLALDLVALADGAKGPHLGLFQ